METRVDTMHVSVGPNLDTVAVDVKFIFRDPMQFILNNRAEVLALASKYDFSAHQITYGPRAEKRLDKLG